MTQTIYGSLKGKSVSSPAARAASARASRVPSTRRAARSASSTTMPRPARRWRKELGERVHFEHSDVRDIPALQAAIRRASDALGPITILVNNAARDDRHTIDR